MRTWNTLPEETTRNCWSWRRCFWVELLSERGRTITNNTILVLRAILKLFVLQHQISSINSRTNRKMNIMSSFIFSVYIRYWFSSPSLTRDATNDLKMYKELSTSRELIKQCQKLLWLSFFDLPGISQMTGSQLVSLILTGRLRSATNLPRRLVECLHLTWRSRAITTSHHYLYDIWIRETTFHLTFSLLNIDPSFLLTDY